VRRSPRRRCMPARRRASHSSGKTERRLVVLTKAGRVVDIRSDLTLRFKIQCFSADWFVKDKKNFFEVRKRLYLFNPSRVDVLRVFFSIWVCPLTGTDKSMRVRFLLQSRMASSTIFVHPERHFTPFPLTF